MTIETTEATEAAAAAAAKPAPTKPARRGKAKKPAKGSPAKKKGAVKPARANAAGKGAKSGSGRRTGTKQEQLIGMLRRAEGATVEEVVKALVWQPHTVRGAIAGALKKKLGLKIVSDKVEERGRVYRIVD
jgi:hypothetical protein